MSCRGKIVCVLVSLMSIGLIGCAPQQYRTNPPNALHDCAILPQAEGDNSNKTAGRVDERCAHSTPEYGGREIDAPYEIHFVEFDEEGWLFTQRDTPSQQSQIDQVMKRLKDLLQDDKTDLKIMVYVHGWMHDASYNDSHVRQFRLLMRRAAGDELHWQQAPKRRVVGIYVAWRGKPAITTSPLYLTSFWSRKDAARRVSTGSVRELFARLSNLQASYNKAKRENLPKTDPASPPREEDRARIRMLMIGHSFGAAILYAATSGPLIEALTAHKDVPLSPGATKLRATPTDGSPPQATERVADLIVLVNPAFEASTYEPLHRVGAQRIGACFQPPLLVSITSSSDIGTRYAFPVGRSINTAFERWGANDTEQSESIITTPGHMVHYWTHWMGLASWTANDPNFDESNTDAAGPCPGYMHGRAVARLTGDPQVEAVRFNKELERKRSADFIDERNQQKQPWKRQFCGGVDLEALVEPQFADAPVWDVIADPSVIDGHGDVMNPRLLDSVRQLFADTELDPTRLSGSCANTGPP